MRLNLNESKIFEEYWIYLLLHFFAAESAARVLSLVSQCFTIGSQEGCVWNAEEGYNLIMFRSSLFQVKGKNIGLGCSASKHGRALRTESLSSLVGIGLAGVSASVGGIVGGVGGYVIGANATTLFMDNIVWEPINGQIEISR